MQLPKGYVSGTATIRETAVAKSTAARVRKTTMQKLRDEDTDYNSKDSPTLKKLPKRGVERVVILLRAKEKE